MIVIDWLIKLQENITLIEYSVSFRQDRTVVLPRATAMLSLAYCDRLKIALLRSLTSIF